MDSVTGEQTGILAQVIEDAAIYCCKDCLHGHGKLHVNWTVDGNGSSSIRNNKFEIDEAIAIESNLVLPIHTDGSNAFYNQNPYIPVAYSPGLAIFSLDGDYVELTETMILETIKLLWVYVVICGAVVITAGLIMWIVVSLQ